MFLNTSQLPEDEVILESYLSCDHTEIQDVEEPWAIDAFRILIAQDPARAWKLICELLARAPERLIPTIGVSLLESFVSRHGFQYIDQIEDEAKKNDRFVIALANVWITRGAFPPDIEARMVMASRGSITLLDDVDGWSG
jgi:hypothetical protein